jgi:hypothetical protein
MLRALAQVSLRECEYPLLFPHMDLNRSMANAAPRAASFDGGRTLDCSTHHSSMSQLCPSREKNEDMVTERLHYFHSKVGGQKYTFGNLPSSSSCTNVDDLCPASLEQRVSACTDVFDVWNTEARRRRVSVAAHGSHNPRRRSLSTGLSSFSFVSNTTQGSTSRRERAMSDSISRSSSSSARIPTLVIRITPSNSYGSLSDLPVVLASPFGGRMASCPSSGCVGGSDGSEEGRGSQPISLNSSSSLKSTSDFSRRKSDASSRTDASLGECRRDCDSGRSRSMPVRNDGETRTEPLQLLSPGTHFNGGAAEDGATSRHRRLINKIKTLLSDFRRWRSGTVPPI